MVLLAIAALVAVAGTAALIVVSTVAAGSSGGEIPAGLIAFLVLFMGSLGLGGTWLSHRRQTELIASQFQQLRALTNVRPILGPFPARFGDWAADPDFCELVAITVSQLRPGLVLECGSGTSTAIIAATLRSLGRGRLVSLDDDPTFAAMTEALIEHGGLADVADVRFAPLALREGENRPWYDFDVRALEGPIELVVVDGPPTTTDILAREPAIQRIRSALAPGCVFLLDDGDRVGEREFVSRWAETLGASLEYVQTERGAWRLTLPK